MDREGGRLAARPGARPLVGVPGQLPARPQDLPDVAGERPLLARDDVWAVELRPEPVDGFHETHPPEHGGGPRLLHARRAIAPQPLGLNFKPNLGNKSHAVENIELQEKIKKIVNETFSTEG